jgi:hypothetical protein
MSAPLNLQEPAVHEQGNGEEISEPKSSRGGNLYHQQLDIDQPHSETQTNNDNQQILPQQPHHDSSGHACPSPSLESHAQLPQPHQVQQQYHLHHHQGHSHQQAIVAQRNTGQSIPSQQQDQEISDSPIMANGVDVASTTFPPPTKKARQRYDNNFKVCTLSK